MSEHDDKGLGFNRPSYKEEQLRDAVVEAAKAALLPIEAYMRARGVPNTTITELLVAVEALEREVE